MVYQYEWSGYKFAVPAQIVGAECERIEKETGSVTSESLVNSARSKTSAIHNLFEWDNKIAGEKWRLQQAKVVLSCLKVSIVKDEESEPKKVRAYLNANQTDSRAEYFNVQKTMQNISLREGVLRRAEKELRYFIDKYRTLTELSKVFDAIDSYFDEKEIN